MVHVEEIGPGGKLKCKLCGFKFCGETHRIRGHFLKVKGCGVGFCSAEESKLRPAAAELRKVEQESQAKQEHGAQKRQLDTASERTEEEK